MAQAIVANRPGRDDRRHHTRNEKETEDLLPSSRVPQEYQEPHSPDHPGVGPQQEQEAEGRSRLSSLLLVRASNGAV
jgi:hypothetical protein